MIILDTTVLAYAVGEEHPLREPCRRLLAAHASGAIEATTTVEVLQEFAHVRARRRSREDAANLTRLYIVALNPIVTTAADLDAGLSLFETYPELGAFAAVLAAVAIARGAESLVSADRAFASVPELGWIDPATPSIEGVLGGKSGGAGDGDPKT
ncbi:MAG TPA: type II toxin-antitoxin system VapC family toxin [Candidatus Limnocylindrales bacterium]